MLTEPELQALDAACLRLPATKVLVEETHVFESPILILMSTVLSLNRRWYEHALPARRHFETEIYPSISPRTLTAFRQFMADASSGGSDHSALARTMWGMNEWDKARILIDLVDYFIAWCRPFSATSTELEALRLWAGKTPKDAFLGQIKGLGPRAFEQLLWYLEGQQAVKLDRHVSRFVNDAIGRPASEQEAIDGLRRVAGNLRMSATELDARIWDYMQSRSRDEGRDCR